MSDVFRTLLAAWGNEDTETLIEILGKYNIKATFFVVGEWVDKYPESVKALHDAGHEIMNHSDTHPHMPKLSAQQMIDEIEKCNNKIEKITGERPVLLRAPYGEYNDLLIQTLEKMNMYCIQWDVDTLAAVGNIINGDIRMTKTQRHPGISIPFALIFFVCCRT